MNELNIQILLELVQKYDKEELKIIKKAYNYATYLHKEQYRQMGFPTKECLSFSPEAFSQVKDYVYCNEHKLSDYYDKVNNSIKPVQTGKKMTLLEQISRYLVLDAKI